MPLQFQKNTNVNSCEDDHHDKKNSYSIFNVHSDEVHAPPGNMNLSRTFDLQTSPLEKEVHLRITALLQAMIRFRGVMSEASQESQGLAQ